MTENVPKLQRHKPTDSRSKKNRRKPQKSKLRHTIIKFLKTKDNEDFESIQKKIILPYLWGEI